MNSEQIKTKAEEMYPDRQDMNTYQYSGGAVKQLQRSAYQKGFSQCYEQNCLPIQKENEKLKVENYQEYGSLEQYAWEWIQKLNTLQKENEKLKEALRKAVDEWRTEFIQCCRPMGLNVAESLWEKYYNSEKFQSIRELLSGEGNGVASEK